MFTHLSSILMPMIKLFIHLSIGLIVYPLVHIFIILALNSQRYSKYLLGEVLQ
jgi:hypothetical protein